MKNLISKSIVPTAAICGCVLLLWGSVCPAEDIHLKMKGAEHLQHLNSPAHASEVKVKREGRGSCAHCGMGKETGKAHSKAGRHTCHPCATDMECGCHKKGRESKTGESAHQH